MCPWKGWRKVPEQAALWGLCFLPLSHLPGRVGSAVSGSVSDTALHCFPERRGENPGGPRQPHQCLFSHITHEAAALDTLKPGTLKTETTRGPSCWSPTSSQTGKVEAETFITPKACSSSGAAKPKALSVRPPERASGS